MGSIYKSNPANASACSGAMAQASPACSACSPAKLRTVWDVVSGGWAEDHPEGGYAPPHEVDALITRLRLDADAQFSTLSGGLKRRAWLGRALVSDPDALLLDEPTNHLDIDSIEWMEEFLLRYVKTLLFVTHDRAFLRRLATRIVEIDRGQILNWDCDYDTYLIRKEAALEAEAKQRALFDKRLAQEEVWVRRGVEARRTKSLARIRELEKMRIERRDRRDRVGNVQLRVQEAERSGRLVVETKKAGFSYGGREIVQDFSTIILRGDKIGIIGPNGSGKTTLLRLLLGQLEPTSGSVHLGTRLQIAYFDQLRAQLDEEATVQQNVAGENITVHFNGEHRHIIGYLGEFLFTPERARTPVKVLSGGERNRLLLAKLFTQPANLLVLDEPTNDLDAETLDLLEELLVEFPGTVLLVSHDRAFLNNVVASTIVFEPDSAGPNPAYRIAEYTGGYDDWLRQRPRQTAAPGDSGRAASSTKISTPAAPAAAKPRKLSFKEERELGELPARIERLESEQTDLAAQMAEPGFYLGDGSAVVRVTARLAAIESELETAFARWEVLHDLESAYVAAMDGKKV